MKDRRSTCRGFCLPATFRPQGLATLSTVSSLRSRAGFVSHRQRSWDSPFEAFPSQGVLERLRPRAPTYRFPDPCSRRKRQAGRAGRGSWAFTPLESPWQLITLLAPELLDAPLGFPLLGCSNASLARDFARAPLLHFAAHPTRPANVCFRVSLGLRLAPLRRLSPTRWWEPTSRSNPSRVCAPSRTLVFERPCPPGYVFTSRRAVHCCRQADGPEGAPTALPKPPRLGRRRRA